MFVKSKAILLIMAVLSACWAKITYCTFGEHYCLLELGQQFSTICDLYATLDYKSSSIAHLDTKVNELILYIDHLNSLNIFPDNTLSEFKESLISTSVQLDLISYINDAYVVTDLSKLEWYRSGLKEALSDASKALQTINSNYKL